MSFSDVDYDGALEEAEGEVLQVDHYYPFGMRMGGLSYNSGTENRYRYNGKEYHQELNLGLYDYGARMYDPVIGRFTTQDRFSEKYFGMAPYQYAANNPTLFVDVNGDSIWVSNTSSRTDDQGNTHVSGTINITGKVLWEGNIGRNEVASGLNERLNDQAGTYVVDNPDGTKTTLTININAQFSGANSMDDVDQTDHLVVVVNDVKGNADPKLGGGPAAGLAEVGGQVAYVESDNAIENAFHEIGHSMGLRHPATNEPNNPMSYHSTSDGSNFSSKQLSEIWRATHNSGSNSVRMNKQFPAMKPNSWGRSTNERPFNLAPPQRALIPKPIKNRN